jgi:serine/threonine-protein phosphatase 6 regulatory ankyrin repeat subunit B
MKKNIAFIIILFTFPLIITDIAYSAISDNEFLNLCADSTFEIINKAIQEGANILAKNNLQQTTLMMAAEWNQDLSVVSALLDAGVDINATDFYGQTALMYAIIRPKTNLDIVSLLLENNADVKVRSKTGGTAMTLAGGFCNDPRVFELLINAGAEINIRENNGNNTLMRASFRNTNTEIILSILQRGIDINAVNDNGVTALMFAAGANDSPEILLLLLELGADMTRKDKNGKKAVDYLEERLKIHSNQAIFKKWQKAYVQLSFAEKIFTLGE